MSEFVEQSLTGVPRTMLLTTRSRVDEHQQPDGLFQDPIVAKWWKSLTWDSTLDPMYKSPAPFTWANRAYIIDRLVAKHLQKYRNAVVVELGAGLSTRYYRIGQDCQRWYELDLPAISELRRQLDLEALVNA